jgi:hypothetical protein
MKTLSMESTPRHACTVLTTIPACAGSVFTAWARLRLGHAVPLPPLPPSSSSATSDAFRGMVQPIGDV